MTLEDITNYYSNLSFINKIRFRKLGYYRKRIINLELKLEELDSLIEELE